MLLNWHSIDHKGFRQFMIAIKCRLDRGLASVPHRYTWLAEIAAPAGT